MRSSVTNVALVISLGAILGALVGLTLAAERVLPDPAKITGPQKETGCGDCHANEYGAWHETKHAKAYEALHKEPKAKEIADKLDVKRIRRADAKCAGCHYTVALAEGRPEVVAGVSCESCHGAGKDWAKVHGNKDDPDRRAKAEKLGMVTPQRVYDIVASCYGCHTVPDEKLINVAGHPTGEAFEFIAYSQGEVRHTFMHGGGKENALPTPERRRHLYVVGRLVGLEMSLRALAQATAAGAYAETSAKRVAAAIDHARAIAKVVGGAGAPITEAVGAIPMNKLGPGNAAALGSAADSVASAARKLAATDAAALAAVDPLVPAPGTYKGRAWQP